MSENLARILEKCTLSIKLSGDGWHITGRGALGVLAAAVIMVLAIQVAPYLIALFSGR